VRAGDHQRQDDRLRARGFTKTSVDLYAEEELERCAERFFDTLTIHMVRGYESAGCRAAHAVA
jgi:hypothetical protein